jgi:hypothetical protein
LLSQSRKIIGRLGETILDRLQHRLHVRERRAQVVACPRDELSASSEESLDDCRSSR